MGVRADVRGSACDFMPVCGVLLVLWVDLSPIVRLGQWAVMWCCACQCGAMIGYSLR